MPNTTTPGARAYDVWRRALQQTVGDWSPSVYATWHVLRPLEHAAWEAAAQAAIAAWWQAHEAVICGEDEEEETDG